MPVVRTPLVPYSSKGIEQWLKECKSFVRPQSIYRNRTSIGPNITLSLHDFFKITYRFAAKHTNDHGIELWVFYSRDEDEEFPFLMNFLIRPHVEKTVTHKPRVFPLDILESLEYGVGTSAVQRFRAF